MPPEGRRAGYLLTTLGLSFCSCCRRKTSSQTRRLVSGSELVRIMVSISPWPPLGFRGRCASGGAPRFSPWLLLLRACFEEARLPSLLQCGLLRSRGAKCVLTLLSDLAYSVGCWLGTCIRQ